MKKLIFYCFLSLVFGFAALAFFPGTSYAQEPVEYSESTESYDVTEYSEECGCNVDTGQDHVVEGVYTSEPGGGNFLDVNGNFSTNRNQDFGQGFLSNVGYVTNPDAVAWINATSDRGQQIERARDCGCWRSTFGDSGGDGGGGSVISACPVAEGTNQFKGCLYRGRDDNRRRDGAAPDGPLLTAPVPGAATALDFNWGAGTPSELVGNNDFAAIWKGRFYFMAGTYNFSAHADDGIKVYINGKKVFENEGADDRKDIGKSSFNYTFPTTGEYSLTVDFQEAAGLAWVNFGWFGGPDSPQCSNANAVGTNRLIGCLWDGTDFNVSDSDAPAGPTLLSPVSDTATALDQDWGQGTPNSFVGNDTFSAKWRGNFTFKAGTYTFYAGADDGVRLKIDGQTKIDDWTLTSYRERSAAVTLSAGVHLVELEYFENQGNARASLRFSYTSDADLDLLNDAASELQFYGEAARTTPKQSFNPNQTIYARVKTRNGGTGAINAPIRVGFYLNRTTGGSPPCGQTPDPSSAFRQLNSLAAGATDTWDFEVQAPADGGTKIAYAFADYQCVVAETNETNNIRSKTYAVIVNAWFETQGGDTASGGTISVSQQPPSGRYQSSYLLAANTIDPKVQISPTAYRLSSYTHPLVPSSGSVYTYMAERFRQRAIDEGEQRCNITSGSLPGNKKYAYCSSDAEFNSGNGPNGDQIWFVDGNLTIKKDLTLSAGDLAIFVVKGNIIINTDVKRSDGIYITDSTFRDTTDLANTFGPQLTVTGGIYGGTVSLSRKLGGADCVPTCDNTIEPAEKVVFDPKYLGRMSPILGSVGVSWLEVNP